jgi:glycosyltransferase involved in cell wall biosynthesis
MAATRILHVVPHPGGGGETYIRYLDAIEGVSTDSLALTRNGRPHETPAGLLRLRREAGGYDLVHIHGDSASLVCLPVIGRRPTVITLNGVHLARRSGGLRGGAVSWGLRHAFERSAGVIAVSESELELARSLAPGAAARIALVHNGVPERTPPSDEQRAATRQGLGIPADLLVVLFAGELTERKQPLEFAAAVAAARRSHPEIAGLMLGEGPLRGKVESALPDGVRLLGHRGDYLELVGAADVAVLPSLWEGLAYAALEPMALGRAMVVSDGPGNADAVGEAGLVFPAGDVAAMADEISRLAADPELRDSLGTAAMARARERFSIAGMVSGTEAVYESALGRPIGP